MVIIKPGTEKGCWRLEGVNRDQYCALIIRCPSCGVDSTMSKGIHTISDDGTVTPSYVCPHTKWNDCQFHEWVKIEGWKNPDPRTF